MEAQWALWTPSAATIGVGAEVEVDRRGHGVVTEAGERYQVALSSGSCDAPRKKLVRLLPDGLVVLVRSTAELRRFARSQVRRGDSALDVGFCGGEMTDRLRQVVGERHLGVEVSHKVVDLAREAFPLCRFAMADALGSKDAPDPGPPEPGGRLVALVDIGGDRAAKAVLQAVRWVQKLRPGLVCVKSESLVRLACDAAPGGGLEAPVALEYGLRMVRVEAPADGAEPRGPAKQTNFGDRWYEQVGLEVGAGRHLRGGHPLKYPMRFAQGRAICRHFNYGVCFRGEACGYCHRHCHHCGQEGHIAKNCSSALECNPDDGRKEPSPGEPRDVF